ncbi:MAG TPA: CRTAC1 family protein [Longimicrobium sp.]
MSGFLRYARRHARRAAALAVVAALYAAARLPTLSGGERAALAARFRFTAQALPELSGGPFRTARPVHPSLAHLRAWISSVGAAVALVDLDGDGLPNDVCHVDPRTDQAIVSPVPGTPRRYAPFALDPAPLAYSAATMAPMGCLPGDVDEDGAMDLVVYYWGRTPVAFLRRAETPSADGYERREVAGGGARWYTNAAAFADVDGDGHPDLVVGNYFPDGARILDARAGGRERMQQSMSRAFNGGRDRVLLWAGPGRFREAPGVFGDRVARGWTLAVGAADLDGDGLPELYLANDFGPDRLLHNRSRPGHPRFAVLEGVKRWTTPGSKVLGRDSFKGMGVDFADLNGDGLLDIYVSNIAGEFSLEESHFAWISTGQTRRMRDGVAPYVDRSEALGLSRSSWGWESRLDDFDNDGTPEAMQAIGFARGTTNRWPELHELAMGNDQLTSSPASWHRFLPGDADLAGHQPDRFFVRARDGRYYDLAREVGLGAAQVTRGIATADVDGDGDLDFALANQWGPSRFYRNDAPRPGAFLGLHLLLPVAAAPGATVVFPGHPGRGVRARPAIGAAATVRLPDGSVRVAQVDGGNGHSGKRSADLHFGLGSLPAGTALRVELRWRGADGRRYAGTLQLTPGWHTVVLGRNPAPGDADGA